MKRKPGRGWKNVGCSVWEHDSGLKVHMMGFAAIPGGPIISGRSWPECKELDRWIQIAGGNQKRGAMLWALSKVTSAA